MQLDQRQGALKKLSAYDQIKRLQPQSVLLKPQLFAAHAEQSLSKKEYKKAVDYVHLALAETPNYDLTKRLRGIWNTAMFNRLGKSFDSSLLMDTYTWFWEGTKVRYLRPPKKHREIFIAVGVEKTKGLTANKKRDFQKGLYRGYFSNSLSAEVYNMARKLRHLSYDKYFERPFRGRKKNLFKGVYHSFRLNYQTSIKYLNLYLKSSSLRSEGRNYLRAFETRMRVYKSLNNRPRHYKEMEKYIRLLKKPSSPRLLGWSVQKAEENIANLKLWTARGHWEQNRKKTAEKIAQQVLVDLDGIESSYASSLRSEAHELVATRVMAERKKFKEAVPVLAEASKHRAPGERAKGRLRFFQGLYSYLAADYEEAEDLLDPGHSAYENSSYRRAARYWQIRSKHAGGDPEGAQDDFLELFTEEPLTYYGHLAYRRLKVKPQVSFLQLDGSHRFDFDDPINWPRVSGEKQKPVHLRRAEELIRLGMLNEAKYSLNEVFRRYPPKTDEKEYGRYLSYLSSHVNNSFRAIQTINRVYIEDPLQLDNPDLKIFYPRPFFDLFLKYSRKKRLDPYLLLAIARQESSFNPNAESFADARGLLQIIPKTGKKIAGEVKQKNYNDDMLFDPAVNVKFSTHYFRQLVNRYKNNLAYSVAAYNAGEEAVDTWVKRRKQKDIEVFVELVPYGETRNYVKKILRNRVNYHWIHKITDIEKVIDNYFQNARMSLAAR